MYIDQEIISNLPPESSSGDSVWSSEGLFVSGSVTVCLLRLLLLMRNCCIVYSTCHQHLWELYSPVITRQKAAFSSHNHKLTQIQWLKWRGFSCCQHWQQSTFPKLNFTLLLMNSLVLYGQQWSREHRRKLLFSTTSCSGVGLSCHVQCSHSTKR